MAPLVVKLSPFGAATRPEAADRNARHLRYIATHGALAVDREEDFERALERGALNARYVAYAAQHEALADPTTGRRLVGNAADAGEAAAQAEARQHAGHQWRFVVSLRGDDADRMGYDTRAWHRLAAELAPRLARVLGMPHGTLRWVAAHHDPPPAPGGWRHPHIHLVIWCSDPTWRRPHRLTRAELRAVRQEAARAVYGPYRAQLGARRTALREAIRQAGATTLAEALAVARQLRRGPSPSGLQHDLAQRLLALAGQMPGRGRAALAYMPAHVKAEARALADYLLQQPPFKAQVDDLRATARQQAELFTQDPAKVKVAEDNAYEDLCDRVAQLVVRAAAQLHRESRAARPLSPPGHPHSPPPPSHSGPTVPAPAAFSPTPSSPTGPATLGLPSPTPTLPTPASPPGLVAPALPSPTANVTTPVTPPGPVTQAVPPAPPLSVPARADNRLALHLARWVLRGVGQALREARRRRREEDREVHR